MNIRKTIIALFLLTGLALSNIAVAVSISPNIISESMFHYTGPTGENYNSEGDLIINSSDFFTGLTATTVPVYPVYANDRL